jgi:hypothetical protein
LNIWEYDDVKRHWIKKCCYKFKKSTGSPGDPKRDMILRYQRIQEQIHEKCTSLITGLEPELELVGDTAGMAGSMVGSRTATPNVLLEVATGGVGVIVAEQVEAGIPSLPPLVTQQFMEGNYGIPQQQLIFSPQAIYLSQQQGGPVQMMQQQSHQPVGGTGQPVQTMQQQLRQPMQQPKKKAKNSSESSLSNESIKNSSLKRVALLSNQLTNWPHPLPWMRPIVLQWHWHQHLLP